MRPTKSSTFALAVAAAAVVWVYFAPTYWIFTASAAVILAITTLGLGVVVGWVREVSLAQAGLTGMAVYLCGYAYRPDGGLGWPFLAAAAFAIGIVVALSVVMALATARLSGIYLVVLTLGVQQTIERTVFPNEKLTGGISSLQTPRPEFLGVSFHSDRALYFLCLGALGLSLLALSRLRQSRHGRSLLLVGVDRQAAASVGVSPWRYKIFAFAIAGFFAGVAGVLTAPLFGRPPSAFSYVAFTSLFYLAIPVLAGLRSLFGVVVVAVIFGLAPQALEPYHISPFLLGGFGLLFGTLAGRGGLSGLVQDRLAALRRRGHDAPAEIVLPGDDGDHETQRQLALRVLEEYLPPPPDSGEALAAADISVAFGGLRALDGVSITVPARRLVGLIGPNGAGKSTLFDVINGLRRPDTGTVHFFARDVTGSSGWDRAALGVSRTFQANRVDVELSVIDNLLAGAYHMIGGTLVESLLGLPRATEGERRAREAAWAVTVLLDLTTAGHEPVGSLDFGTQRRVEIGRSLMSGPRLLLLDEPAAGLDATEAASLFALLRRLEADLGLTVLLVEHYVKAVLENCDLIYVLDQGRLIACGTPAEIAVNPDVRAAYLGSGSVVDTKEGVDA